ncbi:hypothetical protein ACIHFE_29695 [Streptomyces sp. NPDC052396]|uniref:hypothetical protein n=1 Tax=Streptomyces sp. NPDC052396 TaxID=3365689 RepID=UPI0037D66527
MTLFARRRPRSGPPPAAPGPAAAPEAAGPKGTVELHDERLPSCIRSVFFTTHIDGFWYAPDSECHAARARHDLRECARHTLSGYSVFELTAAQYAVNLAIARPLRPTGRFTAYGTARLTVDDADRDLAEEHLHRERSTELEQRDAHRRLVFLQRLLADSDLRLVWWIDQHPDRISDLPQLVKETKDLKPPRDSDHDVLRGEVVRFVDQLLTDMRTPQQREVFLRALTQALHTLGSTELQQTAATWLPTHLTDSGGDTT